MKMTKKNQKLITKLIQREYENIRWAINNGFVGGVDIRSQTKMTVVMLNNAITYVDTLIKFCSYCDLKALERLKQDLLTEYAKAVREAQFVQENDRQFQVV
jgi:hypothetical protein